MVLLLWKLIIFGLGAVTDNKLNEAVAERAIAYSMFKKIVNDRVDLHGKYVVINPDKSIFVADTESEVLLKKSSLHSYVGLLKSMEYQNDILMLGSYEKPPKFHCIGSREAGTYKRQTSCYPARRRWIESNSKFYLEYYPIVSISPLKR